jgi:hypothetical protein
VIGNGPVAVALAFRPPREEKPAGATQLASGTYTRSGPTPLHGAHKARPRSVQSSHSIQWVALRAKLSGEVVVLSETVIVPISVLLLL